MTAREARRADDGREDPDNPVVPFRMSDRLTMYKIQWWLAGVTALIGLGMAHQWGFL